MPRKIIAFLICFCLVFEQCGFAQVANRLPVPGYLAGLVPAEIFRPVQLRAVSFDPASSKFSLFLDPGASPHEIIARGQAIASDLYKYFQIGLRLPNSTFWVNLRPDAPTDIIDPYVEKTDVGRIFLEADLQLKKDMAKLTSPDTADGRQYWTKLYAKAEQLYGADDMEIPALTRPWIVPGEIVIRESKNGAYILKAVLDVRLEQDYLKDSPFFSFSDPRLKEINAYSSELIRSIILPKLAREVNSAKRYAQLRQVYYSLILAQWFKKRLGNSSSAAGQIDTRDLSGLAASKPWKKETYYNAYKKSFSEGEYRRDEEVRMSNGIAVRTYFSGGAHFASTPDLSSIAAAEGTISPTMVEMLTEFRADGGTLIQMMPPVRDGGILMDTLTVLAHPSAIIPAVSMATIGSSLFALVALRLLTGRRLTPRQVLFVLLVGPLVGTFVALWYADSSFLQMRANPSLSLMFPGIGGLMKVGDKSTTQTDISLDQGIADSMKDRGFDKKKLHVKARGPHPAYPKRSIVPDEQVRWITEFLDYDPVEFTHQNVFDNDKTKKPGGWADKPDISEIDRDSIKSYEGRVEFDPEGRPLNPIGRTGMKGRGLLGHWGPNFAADPIITRYNPESGELEVLLILRKDTGEWAIPGGMVDYGEKLSGTLKRELNEETGVVLTEKDMNSGILVYQGYVDDPRNTDNAWMETTAVHLHLTPKKAVTIRLKAGDDAKEVKWIRFNEEILDHLYANHGEFLRNVLENMSSKNNQRPGGIDFRALPLVTQTGIESAVSAQAIDRLQQLAAGSSIRDLDKEWAGIVKQIRGRQMPYAKMQEYAAVCFARNADSRYMDILAAGVNDILKMEEACAVRTAPQMKELLVLIETARGSAS